MVNDTHDDVVQKVKESPENLTVMVVGAGSSAVYHSNAVWVNTANRDTVIMVPNVANTTDVDGHSTTGKKLSRHIHRAYGS